MLVARARARRHLALVAAVARSLTIWLLDGLVASGLPASGPARKPAIGVQDYSRPRWASSRWRTSR